MQIKNAVSMIPYGLLSGIVDGQEVRMWRPWQTEICRTVPRILQGIGIFISQASGDVWKV